MTLREFIEQHYPIKERIENLKSNPIQQILDNDDLPYDCIMVIDGQYQKAVELDDGRFMSIIQLLSYSKSDIDASDDKDLQMVYYAYFDNVEETALELDYVAGAIREYKENMKAKKELLSNVQNSAG